jgi:hypothetical protein
MQSKCKGYPIIFVIAMDHIPIQSSSVPCERAFSSSAETDTKKCNRISPMLMEALQILKFDFKKNQLSFTLRTQLDQRVLLEDDPEEPESYTGIDLDQPETMNTLMQHASHEEGDQIDSNLVLFDL